MKSIDYINNLFFSLNKIQNYTFFDKQLIKTIKNSRYRRISYANKVLRIFAFKKRKTKETKSFYKELRKLHCLFVNKVTKSFHVIIVRTFGENKSIPNIFNRSKTIQKRCNQMHYFLPL